jgi:DNA-binding transcriptional LysR family regulator
MEMHQVRYFLAVARTRNFTRAAEECNVTQPSLTRAIQKLEEEFGGALFRRERALTHLTDLGRLMHPHLERSYEAAQAARTLARQVERADVSPLALGLADDVYLPGLEALLADLERAFAGFSLSLIQAPVAVLMERALRGELDALIASLPGERPDRVDCWPIRHERFRLLVPLDHPMAEAGVIPIERLADIALIGLDAEGAPELGTLLPNTRPPRHRAGSAAAASLLAIAGLGAALLPEGMAVPPSARFVDVDGLSAGRTVALAAIAGRRRSPAADAFLKSVRARGWEPLQA